MKSMGIVRKLDELGRVVIPKEMRKTMRLTEGSNIEITAVSDSEITLKKYSPVFNIADLGGKIADSIDENLSAGCIVTDNEIIVALKGIKKECLYKKPVNSILDAIGGHQAVVLKNIAVTDGGEKFAHMLVQPIVSMGHTYGSIIIAKPQDVDEKDRAVLKVVSGYIARLIE